MENVISIQAIFFDMANPAILTEPVNPDREFLRSIDARVSRTNEGTYCGHPITYHLSVKGEKVTGSEMERILSLANGDDYVIMPVNTDMGFSAAIVVATAESQAPGLPLTSERLLTVTAKQFPASRPWERVAEVYMGPRNLELLAQIGISQPSPNQSRYDY